MIRNRLYVADSKIQKSVFRYMWQICDVILN